MNGGLRSTPLLYPTAAFAVGIVLSVEFQSQTWWIAAALAAAALTAQLLGKGYAGVLAVMVALGCASMGFRLPYTPDFALLTPACEITATVTEARESDSGSRLIVEVRGNPPFKAIVYIRSGEALFHKNDIVRFNGVWSAPDEPADVPYEFSMAPYCFRRGITAICRADRFEIISRGTYMPSFAEQARARLAKGIMDSGVTMATADLLEGLLLGNSDAIDSQTRERFSQAGLAHMLALSGTHLSVITALLAMVFIPLRLGGRRRWAWGATMAAMWCYVLLTGAPASVVRAAVMASFVIAGRLISLPTSSFNSLCAAALAILLFSPGELYSPGFQMSFLAVAGILMFAFRLTAAGPRNPVLRIIWTWCAVCVAAVAGTSGISAWLFHRFPVAFLLSNIPATLLLPLFMGGGILLLSLSLAGIHAGWLAVCVDGIGSSLNHIADAVNSLWWHQVDGLWFPFWTLIFYYGGLLLLYLSIERRKPLYAVSSAITLLTFAGLSILLSPRPPRQELFRITDPFCTAWVVFDDGKAWLVSDTPPRHKEALRNRVGWRLNEPLAIRGIDSLQTAPDSLSTPFLRISRNKVAVGPVDIVFIDRPHDVVPLVRKPCYAVVGSHYRHNIKAVAETIAPDTIILSPSLDYEIEKKFALQLDSLGVAYLREAYRYWK